MRKIDYKTEIKESEEYLRLEYLKLETPKLKERCEILIWLKSGQVKTMKEAMLLKNHSTNHGSNLWKKYKTEGLEKYLELHYKGRKSPLLGKKELEKHLSTKGFNTIKEAQKWILETYEIEYTENGLGNYFRSKKIKLKTGRPNHPKADDNKRAAYKKNTNLS